MLQIQRNLADTKRNTASKHEESTFKRSVQPLARGRTLSGPSQDRPLSQTRPKSATQFSSQSRPTSQARTTSQALSKTSTQFLSNSKLQQQVKIVKTTNIYFWQNEITCYQYLKAN